MKIQPLNEDYINDNLKKLKSSYYREIYFYKFMNKKYPNYFITLYDYKIDNKCKNKKVWDTLWDDFDFTLNDLPKNLQKSYEKLFKSNHCSIKLFSLIDLTLNDLLNKWDKFYYNIYYDLLIQIINIIYIIDKNNFFHNDLHRKNIGLKSSKNKYIEINNHKINTHLYLVQFIDCELNLYYKYDMKNSEINDYNNNNDIYTIINLCLFDFNDLKQYYKNIKINEYDNNFNIEKDDEKLLAIYLNNIELTKKNYDFLLKILFKILFYEKYEKIILGNKFKIAIPPRLYVPMNVILYMIQNIYYPKKILNYLINNM